MEKNQTGFVLKPNCEGGGNNFFNEDVYHKLKEMKPEERQKYILMEKIDTQKHENILINGSTS